MNRIRTTDKPKKSPVAMTLLVLLRLCMIWLICSFYFFQIQDNEFERRIFIVVCLSVFTINHHLFLRLQSTKSLKFLFFIFDLVFISSFGVVFPNPDGPYPLLFGVEGVTLFLLEGRRKTLIIWAVILMLFSVGILTFDVYQQPDSDTWLILFDTTFLAFSCLVGWLIRHFRETQTKVSNLYHRLEASHEQLLHAHDALRDFAQQIETLTMVREQNRIAREIHDTVGHAMTLLIVQLKVAQKLMIKKPDSALESISNCEQVARQALEQIRGSVRSIETTNIEDIPFLTRLTHMTQNFANMTSTVVELHIDGDVDVTRTTVQPVILHIIQESLTNAVRHGDAHKIQVRLRCHNKGIQLDIKDDGHGAKRVTKGFGLTNMEHIVKGFGGTIVFNTESYSGFSISADLPTLYHIIGLEGSEKVFE